MLPGTFSPLRVVPKGVSARFPSPLNAHYHFVSLSEDLEEGGALQCFFPELFFLFVFDKPCRQMGFKIGKNLLIDQTTFHVLREVKQVEK